MSQMQKNAQSPIGVVLMDLGGPNSTQEVGPFIARILSLKSVLPLPSVPRKLVARSIAHLRRRRVEQRYKSIGGKSPIERETAAQTVLLQQTLGEEYLVDYSFLCSAPELRPTLRRLVNTNVVRVVAVPTFPQFSFASSGACFDAFDRTSRELGMASVKAWPQPDGAFLIDAFERIARPLVQKSDWVLFVAHGIPESQVRRGDPYPDEVRLTAAALGPKLTGGEDRWSLAFQSRLGPMRWTGPYLEDELRRLSALGVRALTVVPLSFGCENLETLYDLDQEAANLCAELGILEFRRAPALGSQQRFIEHLASLVRECVTKAGWRQGYE